MLKKRFLGVILKRMYDSIRTITERDWVVDIDHEGQRLSISSGRSTKNVGRRLDSFSRGE